jgi:hypothetical protein
MKLLILKFHIFYTYLTIKKILEVNKKQNKILNKSESSITWQGSFENKTKAAKTTGQREKFIRRFKSLFVGWKVYSSSTNKAKIYSYIIFVQQMYWSQDKGKYTINQLVCILYIFRNYCFVFLLSCEGVKIWTVTNVNNRPSPFSNKCFRSHYL